MLDALTSNDFGESGVAVRLTGGSLAIVICTLPDDRLLVVQDGRASAIPRNSIGENPACCPVCAHTRWWWHGDFVPRCFRCVPPDPEFRARLWAHAERAVAGMCDEPASQLRQPIARRILDHALSTGRLWHVVMRIAFAADCAPLLLAWQEGQSR